MNEPYKVFLFAYAGGSDRDITIPLAVLREAERELDAERERRRLEAEEQARAAEAARKPSIWERLRAFGFWQRK